ncbi:26332_t:CDS:2, partial [Racocetra persica]
CSYFINPTQYNGLPYGRSYTGAFVSNISLTSETVPFDNNTKYKCDLEYDIYKIFQNSQNTPTPFEELIAYKNQYYLSKPNNDGFIYYWRFYRVIRQPISSSFLGYIGYSLHTDYGNRPYIESDMQAVPFPDTIFQRLNGTYYVGIQFTIDNHIFIRKEIEQRKWHNLSMGFVQRSRLFREKYKEKFSPLAVDLQSDDPDIDDTIKTKEYEISSIQKQLDNFEKRLKFYENIIDNSILTFNKTDASPTTGSIMSP